MEMMMTRKSAIFYEKEKNEVDVSEEKVEAFFKCLKKFPNEKGVVGGHDGEPFLVTRNGELPPRWDAPNGTVVLVNKPKGEGVEGCLLCLAIFGMFSRIGHYALHW